MANAQQIKNTAVKVLVCVEKVSNFASSINPLFGIVTALVGVARKGLECEEVHALDKDFQQVHSKLESISKKNQQCLRQIRIDEVNETFGKYEEYIKYQYAAFSSMVALVKKDPENADRHMAYFEKVYERYKSDMSLDVYYRGVMGMGSLFGRPLLSVYLEHCGGDRQVMESRCSHLGHLFHMGLIALIGYTAVTEDDEDEVREKWAKRVEHIQEKMQEVLSRCSQESQDLNGTSGSGSGLAGR
ncbi:protein rapunzel-like [Hypomesus transpacificus]|uniref:protein rapunzel-like n=1 Tax=Hypomesus transpacificus TaxID=137520 RepID=UPI001F074508|nr:protein rapunzel-like [Hypomesus transpacificus]